MTRPRAFRVQSRGAAGLFPLAKRSDRDAEPGRELGLRKPQLLAGPTDQPRTFRRSTLGVDVEILGALGSALRAARGTVPGFFQGGPGPLGPKYTQSFGNGWSLTLGATTDGSARGIETSYSGNDTSPRLPCRCWRPTN